MLRGLGPGGNGEREGAARPTGLKVETVEALICRQTPGRMTQGCGAEKSFLFFFCCFFFLSRPLSTVFECEDWNLCAHHLYLQCSRAAGDRAGTGSEET